MPKPAENTRPEGVEARLASVARFVADLENSPLKSRVEAVAEACVNYEGVFAPLMSEAEFNEFADFAEHTFKGALLACNEKAIEILQRSLGEKK